MRFLLFFLLSLGIVLANFSCANGQSAAPTAKVSLEQFEQHLADPGAQLIDVRTPDEWNEGHLAGATLLNFNGPDFQTQLAKLDKEKPLLLYCAAGGRSGKAATMAKDMGFKNVFDLTGGIGAWRNAGKETVK